MFYAPRASRAAYVDPWNPVFVDEDGQYYVVPDTAARGASGCGAWRPAPQAQPFR
jgi:hypothetical protein